MVKTNVIVDQATVMTKRTMVAEPVNWAQWLCPTAFCTTDRLLVQHTTDDEDLWRVKEGINGQPWLVASTLPGCPFCGSTLQPMTENTAVKAFQRNSACLSF